MSLSPLIDWGIETFGMKLKMFLDIKHIFTPTNVVRTKAKTI